MYSKCWYKISLTILNVNQRTEMTDNITVTEMEGQTIQQSQEQGQTIQQSQKWKDKQYNSHRMEHKTLHRRLQIK